MRLVKEIYNTEFYEYFDFNIIYNDYTLNLFSDASMRPNAYNKNILNACYGSVAVCKDVIIDEVLELNTNCTVPAAEIRGIRSSLYLALNYRNLYKNINIFSDSQIALFGLRDYIYKWRFDTNTNKFYNSNNIKAKNQELYYECLQILLDLSKTNNINLYHQSGHVNTENDIKNSIDIFKRSNNINCKISFNIARYIATYNNYIDNKTRSYIRHSNLIDKKYTDCFIFEPIINNMNLY